MAKRTEREFHIALGKVLDRVRFQNSWSEGSFYEASKHVNNISGKECVRFQKAMLEMNLLKPAGDQRKLTSNFDVVIYKNEDRKLAFIKDILGMFPDIVQHRGRVRGKQYPKQEKLATMEEVGIVLHEEINPLAAFSPQDLVKELRDRGYVVTASRQIMVQEEL